MRRLIRGVQQFLPSPAWITTYWLITVGLLVLVTVGLEATSERSGTLWGLRLRGFGWESQQILNNAYLEMMHHVWTLVMLPFACFLGLRPLVRSFRNDFEQFLRYSSSRRLFIESARIVALGMVVLGLCIPFAAGLLWGMIRPGLGWQGALDGLVSCGGCLLFVCALVYLLASSGAPAEIATGLGLVAPFFLTGLSVFLEKGEYLGMRDLLPPGLPYDVDTYASPNVRMGVLFVVVVIIVRLVLAGRTRWLRATMGHSGQAGCVGAQTPAV